MHKFNQYLVLLFAINFVSAREMVIEPVSSFAPDAGTRKPLSKSLENAKGSICIIKAGTNGERRATGVLIKPNLVVTSMHTFEANTRSDILGPSDTKVAFGITQGDMSTISNWIDVVAIEPSPNNNDSKDIYKDFVVLKLKDDATTKGGKVVGVHWKWGLSDKGSSVQSQKGFMLHFPILLDKDGSPAFDSLDMQISYACSTDAAVLRPNIFLGFQQPMAFSWSVFKEFNSSSGGGVFDDDGNLLGIIKGETLSNQVYTGKPKNVFVIPIDYILDNSSGSSSAISAFSGSTKIIPDAINHFIYTLVHSGSELDAPETTSHFGPTFQQSAQSYSFELSSIVRGASDGIYKINLMVQLSCNSAYNLFDYKNVPVIELSTTGTSNSLLKNLFTVNDIITGNSTSPASYCSGIISFEAAINSPDNVQFTVSASSASNSIFNEDIGALFSINSGNGKRVRSIEGNSVNGSSEPGTPPYWCHVTIINDPNLPSGTYVVGANGEKYDLLGRPIAPSTSGYEIQTYGLTASFVGGVHKFENFDIYWGDGTMETVSNSNYVGKLHSHVYTSPGVYKIEAKYRYKDLFNNVYEDVIHKPPVAISGFSPDVPSTQMILISPVQGSSNKILAASTEVTQAEYYQLTSKLPASYFSLSSASNPIERITWYDAIIFCNNKSIKEGLQPVYSFTNPVYTRANCTGFSNFSGDLSKNGYRLPTPAEWCTIFKAGYYDIGVWGYTWMTQEMEIDLAERVSWYNGNSGNKTHPVAQKIPNPWGFFDVAGNVSEWAHLSTLENGNVAPVCGGNFKDDELFVISSGSSLTARTVNSDYIGMRVVRNAPAAPSISANVNINQSSFPVKASFSFSNSGGTINYVFWDFGDGIVSNDSNPVHAYNKTGSFIAKCIAYGDGGLSNSTLTINIPELGVYVKDEGVSELNLAKIRMYVSNNTPYSINNFSANYYFKTESGKTPVLDVYWNPFGKILLENVSAGLYRVRYDFTDQTLRSGSVLPSSEGSLIGLHYSDWSTLDKSDDFSNPNSSSFVLSKKLPITSNTTGSLVQGQLPQFTPIQDSITPANPYIITGSGIFDVTPAGNTYTCINTSYHHGMMFTIRNVSIDDSVTVKWFGVLDQNASDCMHRSICLSHTAYLNGNGAQVNNICTSRGVNGTMAIQLKSVKACKVYIDVFDWVNGVGCY